MEVLNTLSNPAWSIGADGIASFASVTINNSSVLTKVTGAAGTDYQYTITSTNSSGGTTTAIIPSYTSKSFTNIEGTAGGFLADVNMVNDVLDYVDEKVSALVNGAPETLDTLDEIAAALNDNADIVTTLNSAIGTKANASDVYTKTQADAAFQAKGTYLTAVPMASTSTLGGIKTDYTQQDKSYPVKVDSSGNAYVNVPWTDNNTTYSKATASTLGLVKVGAVRTSAITTNSATSTSGRYYAVEIDSNGKLFVNVPWEDTDEDTVISYATSGTGNAITSADFDGTTLTFSKGSTFFLASNFTKANITSTLGISDWALASAKPTYTTTDVTEGTTNLYFTNDRAQAAITGGASTVAASNLTASRALISNASGKIAVSAVTSTELGYLDGVTSSIQTQLNTKASTSSLSTTNTNVTNLTTRVTDIEAALGDLGELSIKDSVSWSEVTGKPTFADVATSGSYADLANKPTIPTLSSLMGSSAIGSTSSFVYWNGSAWKSQSVTTYTLSTITGTLAVTKGGTGATTAAAARTNLGLGGAATYAATTSVASGSNSLVTSGAVYTALAKYLPLAGGTMTGAIEIDVNDGEYIHAISGDEEGNLLLQGSEGVYVDNSLYISYGAYGYDGTSTYWRIDSDGAASFKSITQTSDVTRKNVIDHDVQLTLESIANAPILKYTWLSGKDATEHVGSSAQYWQNVVPECVRGEEGKDLGMDYGTLGLITSITNAREILELKQEIATLKQQLSELQ